MSRRLDEATKNLLNFISMKKKDRESDFKYELELIKGRCYNTMGLRNNDNVSISLCRYEDICESGWHSHEEREIFILYTGEPYI